MQTICLFFSEIILKNVWTKPPLIFCTSITVSLCFCWSICQTIIYLTLLHYAVNPWDFINMSKCTQYWLWKWGQNNSFCFYNVHEKCLFINNCVFVDINNFDMFFHIHIRIQLTFCDFSVSVSTVFCTFCKMVYFYLYLFNLVFEWLWTIHLNYFPITILYLESKL